METQEAVRTAPAQARPQPRQAAKSTAPPADPPAKKKTKKTNNEGAVEHADAASFVLAGGSSLSEAAFAASYPATSWGNPGQIQAKVYVSVSVW